MLGTRSLELDADSVDEALEAIAARHGEPFLEVLAMSRLWRNGESTERDQLLADGDELAILPPVSGGCAAFAPQWIMRAAKPTTVTP